MAAIVDLRAAIQNLGPRERIIEIARLYLGTPYGYGKKGARSMDGAHFAGPLRPIDCSGFVRNVYDEAFPAAKLAARDDLNVATFRVTDRGCGPSSATRSVGVTSPRCFA